MNAMNRRQVLACGLATALPCVAVPALGQGAYPSRSLKLVVPYGPGGSTDVAARLVADHMGRTLGQPIVVENRPGGAANPGTASVAGSAPDGYTLLLGTSHVLAGNAAIFPKLPFDPIKDFAPIGMIFLAPSMVMVHPGVQARSVAELIALIKPNPGKFSYGSGGIGASSHFAGEMMNYMAGTKMVHVPYKGDAASINDAIGGHVPVVFCNIPSGIGFHRSGQLRALGVTSSVRVPAYRDIPTIAEGGLPGFDLTSWFTLMAPAGTPEPVVRKLSEALAEALRDNAVRDRVTTLGGFVSPMKPDELGAFIRMEIPKWTKIARDANIRAQE
ncbi:MAG: tripartite tricarboxylate transporter substrate binding protein [Desulfobacterales bacterium]|nr:tripartite tricarboxylate transporter substrate binding protein [Desulfobacterales bacterium]